jgi:hypothetical protein
MQDLRQREPAELRVRRSYRLRADERAKRCLLSSCAGKPGAAFATSVVSLPRVPSEYASLECWFCPSVPTPAGCLPERFPSRSAYRRSGQDAPGMRRSMTPASAVDQQICSLVLRRIQHLCFCHGHVPDDEVTIIPNQVGVGEATGTRSATDFFKLVFIFSIRAS